MDEAKMLKLPEHEKLKKISDQSQACGLFVERLLTSGMLRRTQKRFNLRSELARFFNINEKKLEAEKDAMLNQLRSKVK